MVHVSSWSHVENTRRRAQPGRARTTAPCRLTPPDSFCPMDPGGSTGVLCARTLHTNSALRAAQRTHPHPSVTNVSTGGETVSARSQRRQIGPARRGRHNSPKLSSDGRRDRLTSEFELAITINGFPEVASLACIGKPGSPHHFHPADLPLAPWQRVAQDVVRSRRIQCLETNHDRPMRPPFNLERMGIRCIAVQSPCNATNT